MSWMIKPEGKFRYNRDFAKKAIADHRYDNSEKGFVGQKYIHFTKPSAMKKRHYVKVNLDKIDYWVEYLNHKLIMKEKFPLSDGKLCRYCETPFTFIVPIKNFGKKNLQVKRGITKKTNMSVDRLDNNKGYEIGNIIFCCAGCNNRKNQVRLKDCENILRVVKEVQLECGVN